ncbi:MAG: hypothetical protein L5655_07815 [Thermosediminibacteraceae bacterium]|nr:hypothetical protein [Thermosediminibacteraceae bacterium]
MDRLPLSQILFISIPEALAVTFLATVLIRLEGEFNKKVLAGIFTAIASNLLRPYLGSYVLNILIYDVILIMFIRVFLRTNIFDTVMGVLVATAIYAVIEFINMTFATWLLKISPVEIIENFWLRVIVFSPQLLAVILLIYLLVRHDISLK